MRRQNNGRLQSGYRGYVDHDDRSSSDGLAYSSSSGGSNRQAGPTRPVIRPPLNPVSRVRAPEQPHTSPDRADSPTTPETSTSERSSFILNGQQINETYKPKPSAAASQSTPSYPESSTIDTERPRQRVTTHYALNRPPTYNTRGQWALGQQSKVRILGIPKQYWTKDVYLAMSKFGTVIKVDMEIASRDNNAWVIFQ